MTDAPDDKNAAKDLLEWLGFSASPNWAKARTLGGSLGVILTLFFVVAFVAAASVLYGTIRDVFGAHPSGPNLGAGALITALLGAPFLIWSTVIKHRALGFQKEGHLTDRISKAVEQLGAEKTVKRDGEERTVPNIEVRIGGILSLERIAQDSTAYDKGRDHVRCMEILCAYIRENAPASEAKDHDLGEWEPLADDATEEMRAEHLAKRKVRFGENQGEGQVYQWAQTLNEPRADIALALRVIGRRDADQRLVEARWGKDSSQDATWVFDQVFPFFPYTTKAGQTDDSYFAFRIQREEWENRIRNYRGYRLDLHMTNLQRADLSNLFLSGAILTKTRLDGADLHHAQMVAANLWEATMEGINGGQARLEGAHMHLARMEGARLQQARMDWAALGPARMEGAQLNQARLTGAYLYRARMETANLESVNMEWARLVEARMEGAHLLNIRMDRADAEGARMEGVNLGQARLEGANLVAATFRAAALYSTDLTSVFMTRHQICSSFGDASVILPDDLPRRAHWPKIDLKGGFEDEWRKWQASPETYVPPKP